MWIRIILIIIVLAVAAYGFVWFRHADQTEEMIVATIERWNADDKGIEVTYEDISVSGFPFTFETHITNPAIKTDTTKLTSSMFTGFVPPVQAPDTLPPMTDNITMDGDVVLSTNYFTRTFGMTFEGTSTGESHVGDKILRWKTSNDTLGGCSVTVTPEANMSIFSEHMFSHLSEPKNIIDNFRSIDCLGGHMEVVNQETGDMLHRGGDQIFSVSLTDKGENEVSINAALSSRDLEMSDTWRKWMDDIMNMMNVHYEPTDILPINSHAEIGKQDIDVQFSYTGPFDVENMPEDANIYAQASDFSVTNDLYTLSMPFTLNIQRNGSQVTGSFTLDGETRYEEKMDDVVRRSVNQMVDDVYAGKKPKFDMILNDMSTRISSDEYKKILDGMVPALGKFSTVITKADVTFKGSENAEFHHPEGTVNIADLQLKMGDYGFSMDGSATMPPPRGELSLRCHKCRDTVDKLLLYIINFQTLVALTDPQSVVFPVSHEFRSAIGNFVEAISVPIEGQSDDRVIVVSDSGNGQTIISGKNMEEVMMLGMQMIMPHLMQTPPPGMPVQ